MTSIEQRIGKRIGKAIYKYKMIQPNDRILVAVSGGKDSLTMLHDLLRRKKSFPIPYEIEAVHIQTDFCSCCKKSKLEELFQEWGATYHIIPVPVMKRLKDGQKMNCYWCSSQRRMELLKLAKERNCNKVALGHHMDDIVETLLMNICYKGEVATMMPVFTYHKFPYTVIRPLAMVKEREVIRFATDKGLSQIVCKCPYGQNSKRKVIREAIAGLSRQDKAVREMIFKSMSNVNMDYLYPEDKCDNQVPPVSSDVFFSGMEEEPAEIQ